MVSRRLLIEVMVSVLLIQWVGAFSHCLRLSSLGIDLAICSSSKPSQTGTSDDPRRPAERQSLVCPVCSALPAVEAPEAPIVAQPVVWIATPDLAPQSSSRPLPMARAPPPPARAPPTLA